MEIKKRLQEKQNAKPKQDSASKIPDQYPSKKNKDHVVNLCSTIADLGIESDDESTDDEAITSFAYMVKSTKLEPEGMLNSEDSLDLPIQVRAHLEYGQQSWYPDKVYAIADGGADSCIVGKHAKVLSYTGRFANLIGYDPKNTRTDKVPIVTALLKVKSNCTGNIPVLLKVHEAPYNSHSPVTLLSEYQIREYGLVIDSVAKKHMSSHGQKGTQRFEVKGDVHIDFEDRGGLMGFEILPLEPGDEDIYDIITITNPERWHPHKFQFDTYHTSTGPTSSDTKDFKILDASEANNDSSIVIICPERNK